MAAGHLHARPGELPFLAKLFSKFSIPHMQFILHSFCLQKLHEYSNCESVVLCVSQYCIGNVRSNFPGLSLLRLKWLQLWPEYITPLLLTQIGQVDVRQAGKQTASCLHRL